MKTLTKILMALIMVTSFVGQSSAQHQDTGITFRTDAHTSYDTGNAAYHIADMVNYCSDADSVYFTWYGGDTLVMEGLNLSYIIVWHAGPFYSHTHKAAIPIVDFNYGDTTYVWVYSNQNNPWYTKIYPQNSLLFTPTITGTAPYFGVYCDQKALVTVHISSSWNYTDSIVWSYGGRGVHDTVSDTTFSSWSKTYKVQLFLTSDSGCYAVDSVKMTVKRELPNGSVCWATVDTTNTHNIIVWDTTGLSHEGIDSLRLYYYNVGWHLIGEESILVPDTSRYFVDETNVGINGPAGKAETYMILSVDSCGDVQDTTIGTTTQAGYGGVFNPSASHTTMNITMSPAGTFNWGSAPYEIGGSSPSAEYYLFRNDSIVDSASGVQQFTDLHYNPTAKYYVGIKLLSYDMCPVTARALGHRALTNSSTFLSHSNRLVNGLPASVASINNESLFRVYPNPSNGAFNIEANTKSILKIYNVVGEEIFAGSLNDGENVISLAGHSPGIYLYQILSENEGMLCNGKLVIE